MSIKKLTSKYITYIAGLAAGLVAGLSLGLVALPATVQAAPTTALVAAQPTATVAAMSSQLEKSGPWYIVRASGIMAAILLGLLIASGVGLLTGATFRMLEPLPAWAAHRAIGIAFGVMVLIHGSVLLLDKFVGFSLVEILVPFNSDYRTVTVGGQQVSLYMALGIIAMYLIALIIITSLLWMQKRPKPWRLVHYLSYAVLAMVFVHGLFIGTDLKQGWARGLWVLAGLLLLAAILPRLRRVGTLEKYSVTEHHSKKDHSSNKDKYGKDEEGHLSQP